MYMYQEKEKTLITGSWFLKVLKIAEETEENSDSYPKDFRVFWYFEKVSCYAAQIGLKLAM